MLPTSEQTTDKVPLELFNKIYCMLNDDNRLPDISTESILRTPNARRVGDDVKDAVIKWLSTKSKILLLSRNSRDVVMQHRYEIILLQDSSKLGWNSLMEQLKQVDSYGRQYGNQVKELVLDVLEPDLHLVNTIHGISTVVPYIRNATVDIPLFENVDLYDSFVQSFMQNTSASITNLNWSVGDPDEHGVLFSNLKVMTALESLKIYAGETQYNLSDADQHTVFPHLRFIEFHFLRQNSTMAAEIFAAWQLPSFTGLSLRGRPTGLGIMPIFIMHGSKLKFLELLVNVPILHEILQLASGLEDLIYDVSICQEIILFHDNIRQVGIRGTGHMDLHGNEIIQILEETMHSLADRAAFPKLQNIRIMEWSIRRLRLIMWSRTALIFWSKWIAITRERGIRLEDIDGIIIPEDILYDD